MDTRHAAGRPAGWTALLHSLSVTSSAVAAFLAGWPTNGCSEAARWRGVGPVLGLILVTADVMRSCVFSICHIRHVLTLYWHISWMYVPVSSKRVAGQLACFGDINFE